MEKTSLKQKNYAIEWYRYFFAIFICTLHFKEYCVDAHPYPFSGSYLAVEFFLLAAGFFLAKSVDDHPNEGSAEDATLLFAKKRF